MVCSLGLAKAPNFAKSKVGDGSPSCMGDTGSKFRKPRNKPSEKNKTRDANFE